MKKSGLRIDTSRFARALAEMRKYSKRDFDTLLREQARGFVRHVIGLTPPARGKADSNARKRGEAMVSADLAKIFKPVSARQLERFESASGGQMAEKFGHRGAAALGEIYTKVLKKGDLVAYHQARRRRDGRVMAVNRDATTGLRARDLRGLDVGLVEKKTYEWFKKRVQARVGLLGGGWNNAAAKLGYNPPAWIRRHGTGRGDCIVSLGGDRLKIRVSNDVPFAASVRGMTRRVNQALNLQARGMERRVAHAVAKGAKRAGLRAR